jgi:hypothetical protein
MSVVVLITQRRIRGALALAFAVLILVTPLVIRNRVVNGSWAPTRSGLNLYIGNSALTSALLPDYVVDILQEHADNHITAPLSHLLDTSPQYTRAADALLARSST